VSVNSNLKAFIFLNRITCQNNYDKQASVNSNLKVSIILNRITWRNNSIKQVGAVGVSLWIKLKIFLQRLDAMIAISVRKNILNKVKLSYNKISVRKLF
jgi:hypothetical protein